MSVNVAEMEVQGWGRELALLGAQGYRCVRDNDDGELPVAIFAKIEDGFLHIIQGMDFDFKGGDDRLCVMFPVADFEAFASTVMGMIMAAARPEETSDAN